MQRVPKSSPGSESPDPGGTACSLWFQVCIWVYLMTAQLMPTHQSSVASCLPSSLSPAFHTHFPPQPAQTAPPGSSSPASPLRCPCTTRTLRQEGNRGLSRPDGATVSFSPIRGYSNALVARDVFSPWCSLWQERRTYFGSLQHLPWYWSWGPPRLRTPQAGM